MTDLELHPDLAPAPTTLFASDDPRTIVSRATQIANAIAPLIRERNLFKRIGASDHVYLEGWTIAGTMLGVFPITVASGPVFAHDGTVLGYQATVEARTMAGAVVGRAEAECTRDENEKWAGAPSFQLRSMAQTRGASKALRMPLGFVMKLAGYETTPAEEMEAAAARGETVSGGRGVAPGWRDLAEQNSAHRRMDAYVAEHFGDSEWVAMFCDSKGYTRPLSKPQMADLRRAMDRELADQQSGVESPTPAAGVEPTPDPTTRSPSTREQEASPTEAGRSRVEGANHGSAEPGVGTPPSDATTPPEGSSPPGRPSGGTKRSRPATSPGKADPAGRAPSTEEAEQAAFERTQVESDPGRFAR